MMQRTIPLSFGKFLGLTGFILAVTIATGVVYGHLSQRWGPVSDLTEAADQLQNFPRQISEWRLLDEEPMSESAIQMLSCAGYVNRTYVNRQTGQTVSVAIIVGPPGPISVHTPEICYSSRAYEVLEPKTRVTLNDREGRSHSLWSIAFRSTRPMADGLAVFYAWTSDGKWKASASPRFEFAHKRKLFKLQMATHLSPSAKPDDNPCQDFLLALLDSDWSMHGEAAD